MLSGQKELLSATKPQFHCPTSRCYTQDYTTLGVCGAFGTPRTWQLLEMECKWTLETMDIAFIYDTFEAVTEKFKQIEDKTDALLVSCTSPLVAQPFGAPFPNISIYPRPSYVDSSPRLNVTDRSEFHYDAAFDVSISAISGIPLGRSFWTTYMKEKQEMENG